jgi:hypothetical protein
MGAGSNGFPMAQQPPAPSPKTWLDRLLPLLHLVSMIALAVYTITVWEPTARLGDSNAKGLIDWGSWAVLGKRSVGADELASVVCLSGPSVNRVTRTN